MRDYAIKNSQGVTVNSLLSQFPLTQVTHIVTKPAVIENGMEVQAEQAHYALQTEDGSVIFTQILPEDTYTLEEIIHD